MRYVLDASVAVSALRPKEPQHAVSFKRVQRVQSGADQIVVPSLFSIEVTAGLTRSGVSAADVRKFVDELLAVATVVTIGPVRARLISKVAMRTRLRAADAHYVWLAEREGVPLVTADNEVLQRSTSIKVERP